MKSIKYDNKNNEKLRNASNKKSVYFIFLQLKPMEFNGLYELGMH